MEPLLPSPPVPGTQSPGLLGFQVNKQITELLWALVLPSVKRGSWEDSDIRLL